MYFLNLSCIIWLTTISFIIQFSLRVNAELLQYNTFKQVYIKKKIVNNFVQPVVWFILMYSFAKKEVNVNKTTSFLSFELPVDEAPRAAE